MKCVTYQVHWYNQSMERRVYVDYQSRLADIFLSVILRIRLVVNVTFLSRLWRYTSGSRPSRTHSEKCLLLRHYVRFIINPLVLGRRLNNYLLKGNP